MTLHYLLPNAPAIDQQTTTNLLFIILPHCCTIASPHTCLLDLPQLPIPAQIAYIVFDLAHSSLLSVKQFCSNECRVEYDATNWYVYFKNKTMLQGPRNETTKLWILPLRTDQKPTLSYGNKISKLPLTRQSKNDNIDLITLPFRNFNNWNLFPMLHICQCIFFATCINMDHSH